MQMINQLAVRIAELHRLGYVHRDLKPGNVMWLPRENRWTIIDFGCVAVTGETARLSFSLAYAASEIITAYRRGDHYIVAQARNSTYSFRKNMCPLSILGKIVIFDKNSCLVPKAH